MAAETLDAQVARLYMQGRPHAEIGEALNLARPYVHKVLSGLFAEAMPKLGWRSLNDEKLNAIQQAYLRGGASIQKGTDASRTPDGAAEAVPIERVHRAARNYSATHGEGGMSYANRKPCLSSALRTRRISLMWTFLTYAPR